MQRSLKDFFIHASHFFRKFFGDERVASGTKCVVGLGNPGAEYSLSRHNIGFRVVESIAASLNTKMRRGSGEFLCVRCVHDGLDFLIIEPQTFMNRSGTAVREAMKQFHLTPDRLLVIYDDFQIPLGTLRMRKEGGDGGHNGIGSVIGELQTADIARLRVGIAGSSCPQKSRKEQMANYVLSPFEKDEEERVEKMIVLARNATLDWVHYGVEHAMSKFNKSFVEGA